MSTLPIVELVELCEVMASRNQTLFERIGGWVTDEPDPSCQQWFAVACHRHAWHGQLWQGRRPTIPVVPPPRNSIASDSEPDDRPGWYANQLAELRAELAEIASRVDPVLDPSTVRVITLVAADLADLASPPR